MKNINENQALRDIQKYAKKFLMDEYGIELNIPVKLNGRLTSCLGRFIHTRDEKTAIEMDFSKNLIRYYKLEEIIGTIKHECIHYALFTLKKPYNDGDDYFEKELRKHGAPSTEVGVYHGKLHQYKCSCGMYAQRRKFDVRKYKCSKCKGRFEYVKQIIV